MCWPPCLAARFAKSQGSQSAPFYGRTENGDSSCDLFDCPSWKSLEVTWLVATQIFFMFIPKIGEDDSHFDEHIFERGLVKNHQLVTQTPWRCTMDPAKNEDPWRSFLSKDSQIHSLIQLHPPQVAFLEAAQKYSRSPTKSRIGSNIP